MSENLHQPIKQHDAPFLRCSADGCHFAFFLADYPNAPDWEEVFRKDHTSQYEPGRAPDITVDWEVVASCSVCPDGGDVDMCEDGEAVCCQECCTHWDMNGSNGQREDVLELSEADS